MNKNTWKTVALMLTLASVEANAAIETNEVPIAVCDNVGKYITQRPKEGKRLFQSDAVEKSSPC